MCPRAWRALITRLMRTEGTNTPFSQGSLPQSVFVAMTALLGVGRVARVPTAACCVAKLPDVSSCSVTSPHRVVVVAGLPDDAPSVAHIVDAIRGRCPLTRVVVMADVACPSSHAPFAAINGADRVLAESLAPSQVRRAPHVRTHAARRNPPLTWRCACAAAACVRCVQRTSGRGGASDRCDECLHGGCT